MLTGDLLYNILVLVNMTKFDVARCIMCQMNVLEAKTNFSKLLMLLENKEENEIIICKNNKPVARITLIPPVDRKKSLGIAAGKYSIPDNFDDENSVINAMFYGEENF